MPYSHTLQLPKGLDQTVYASEQLDAFASQNKPNRNGDKDAAGNARVDIPEGGWGLFITRSTIDCFHLDRTQHGNILHLELRL